MLSEQESSALYLKNHYQTINAILAHQKKHHPDKIAYRFVLSDHEAVSITYAELYDKTHSLAFQIQKKTKPFDRVILSARPGLEFIIGFYACLLARVIAVPAIPPVNLSMATRFLHIMQDATPQLILFDKKTAKIFNFAQKAELFIPNMLKHFVEIHEVHSELFKQFKNQKMSTLTIEEHQFLSFDEALFPECLGTDIVFLQYTSGSIGHPKGVMISHANLLDNIEIIRTIFQPQEKTESFFWLPPTHDMGLIGSVITPLYTAVTSNLMSPLDFLERPSRWVQYITKYRCNITGAPNFAYELCALRTPEELVNQIDLSCLEVSFNGAEPLNSYAMELFYNKFKKAGLRKGVILPCYGLAESTLLVSGKPKLIDDTIINIDPEQYSKNVIEIIDKSQLSKSLVSSGIARFNIKIVDPNTLEECLANQVGEIWLNGASISSGYFNNIKETEKTFHAQIKGDEQGTHYLRTGDLGFIHGGELFVSGRIKNMIIILGQNYYPQDIEYAVTYSDHAIRKGCVVAYGIQQADREALVVVAEIRKQTAQKNLPEIVEHIQSEISQQFHLTAQQIILVAPKTIPKTSSGKLQRIKCQELIETQQIKPIWHYISEEKALDLAVTDVQQEHPAGEGTWITQFNKASLKERKKLITELVLSVTAKTLSIADVTRIDVHKGFFELGMDSIKAVELKTHLQDALSGQLILDNSLVFNFPNIKAVIDYLLRELNLEAPKKSTSTHYDLSFAREDIAIIGMSCTVPGAANIDEFWRLLIEGREGITEVPANRWNKEEYYSADKDEPGKMVSKRGGFVDKIEEFDASFFSISPKELEYLDPQQRMLLMNTWTAFEQANLNPIAFRGSNTGVFIGISSHDYESLIIKNISELKINPYWGTGNAASTATGRLSYYFGFEGPNMAIETACSSSLVALHEACRSLQSNECNLAVVGGVNAILSPDLSIIFSKAGMLAPDGRCKTFDEKADGYVRGEGCGIVLLKRKSEAVRDKDTILAVIKASGVNQDGASSGLTVPNGEAQEKLLSKVLAEAQLKSADIDYVECHGTGTSLGDPIEIQAIGKVYGLNREPNNVLKLGSVKTNIGHLEAAAGMAGLIKTVLALQHGELPKHLNFEHLNPFVQLNFPAEIVTKNEVWETHSPMRHAAVSSFGFSGTNAHMILEEAPNRIIKEEDITLPQTQIFVLSAKTQKSLDELIQTYIHYLEHSPEQLAHICYTSAIGRSHFTHRIACLVHNKEDLIKQLKSNKLTFVEVSLNDELITSTDFNIVLSEYLSGKFIDWETYYKPYHNALRKVSLPTYCFDTQKYWLDIKKTKVIANREVVHERYLENYELYTLPLALKVNQDVLVVKGSSDEDPTNRHVVFVYENHFKTLVSLAKKLLVNKPLSFTLVTHLAFGLEAGDEVNPGHTQALGFWRTLYQEVGGIPCYLIDIKDKEPLEPVLDLIGTNSLPEPQIILRENAVYVPRLFNADDNSAAVKTIPHPFNYRADATYLITGGTGGLGFELAKHLIQRGVKHLALTSRSKTSDELKQWMEQQQAEGVSIRHYAADVADTQALKAVFDAIAESGFPLKGIFHLAGLLHDGLLLNLRKEDIDAVLAPKVQGSRNLDELSQSLILDCFVLFSSMSALLGNPGQSNYSAANAFMNGLAIKRRHQMLPALSINWGPFGGVGMASGLESVHKDQGIKALTTQHAFATLDALLTTPEAQIGVIDIDWSKVAAQSIPYLAHLVAPKAASQGEWVTLLAATPNEHREQVLTDKIKGVIAEVLNSADPNSININKGFFDLGMDSIMALDLKNTLQTKVGFSVSLANTVVFDYSNVKSLSAHLLERLDFKVLSEKPPAQISASSFDASASFGYSDAVIRPKRSLYMEGGEDAVLLFYGLNGSPLEIIELAKKLNESGYTVEIPYIDCYTYERNKKTYAPFESWVLEALTVFRTIKSRYKTVSVGGHCGGAVMALRIAELVGNEISTLVLLSASLYLVKRSMPWHRFLIQLIYYSPWRYKATFRISEPSIKNMESRALLSSLADLDLAELTIYHLHHMFRLNHVTIKNLSLVTCPTLIMHAKEDDIASLKNLEVIANNIQSTVVEKIILYDSYHMITVDNEKDLVAEKYRNFLDINTKRIGG